MRTFIFHVFNKRHKTEYYLPFNFEAKDIKEAKRLFSESPEAWRYNVLDVDFYEHKDTPMIEGDYETGKTTITTTP